MRSALIAIALLIGAPAIAAETTNTQAVPVALKYGMMLRDANNVRVGTVSRVNADGSVGVIVESKFVTIPASALNIVDGKAVTTLTKREIVHLR